MNVRKTAVSGVLMCGLGLGLATASPAVALCDAYSGGCPTTPPTTGTGGGGTDIGGGSQNPGTSGSRPDTGAGGGDAGGSTDERVSPNARTSQPTTLPFTGGELVLMTALGAGALAGGIVLVVAGRRKRAAAS